MNKTKAIGLILVAAISALGIHVSSKVFAGLNVDITEDHLYSLTEGSDKLLAKMVSEGKEPITLRLVFSESNGKTLPSFIKQFLVYAEYLETLLGQYAKASDGRITVEIIDPLSDSDEEQLASDAGLDGKSINQHGDLFFFGLIAETRSGRREVIDFLWPDNQEMVEYEISRRIDKLLWPRTEKIGVISSLEVLPVDDPYMQRLQMAQGRQPSQPWLIIEVLRSRFEVEAIPAEFDSYSKDDYAALLIVHPKDLSDKQLWAVDEWVSTGGNAVVLVDPFAINDNAPANPNDMMQQFQYSPASDLEPLLGAWGVELIDGQVLADPNLAIRRQTRERGAVEAVIIDLQMSAEDAQTLVDQEPLIARGLGPMRFFAPGILRSLGTDGIEVRPLIQSTERANGLSIAPGFPGSEQLTFLDANDPVRLRSAFTDGHEQRMIAAFIEGQLGPAYPTGATFPAETPETPLGLPPGFQMPVPEGTEMIVKEGLPAESLRSATVIVFADSDFISDQLAFQQSFFGAQMINDNAKLLMNSLEVLMGAPELITVRAKSSIDRPFELFDEIEASAELASAEREQQLRDEVAEIQDQISAKRSGLSGQNVALLEKKVADEIAELESKVAQTNAELKAIRLQRRQALEGEQNKVRFAMLGLAPLVVLGIGLGQAMRRRKASEVS